MTNLLLFSLLVAIPILFFSSYLLWVLRFSKTSSHNLPVLVYHKIENRFEWGITRQKVKQFEEQIKYLREQGYRSARMDEVLNTESSKDSKRILITFDD